jgi:dUTP pyrophosphatase
MNVYLACTVRGDRGAIQALRDVAAFLEERGHCVLTRHLLVDDVERGESALTEREVFERDMEWLGSADVVIADASGSSYGVGYEVGYTLGQAGRTGQRVLLLYAGARRGQVSRLIAGNTHPNCRTAAYQDAGDLLRIVDTFMANATGSSPPALRVRIHRMSASVSLPRYESAQAAAFDLAASTDVLIEPGQVSLVPTGLVIEVPAGKFLGIFARSSTPLKRGLMVANGVGVVDPDYCGPRDEIKIALLNFSAQAVQVRSGDRLAQGIVLPATRVEWEETGEVRAESRGGFGSTG